MTLPFDAIKIDKSIFYESIKSKVGYQVLKGLCNTFKSIGLKIIMEGIETEEQSEIVRKLDVKIIQGYYYSKPEKDVYLLEKLGLQKDSLVS